MDDTDRIQDPLLMNAFNDVNLAGACILTSTEFAERMGIPREKWIFSLGGGRAEDSRDRKSFSSCFISGQGQDLTESGVSSLESSQLLL